jgi:TolB-like protein/Tfp pilus assembly protein PilF
MMADFRNQLTSAIAARYTIERELGRGGMAAVYLATDVRHRRQVALKVLDPELARAIGPRRFLQEIDIAAKLTHPNILPLYDSGEADGILYYVMPYVDGKTLRDRLSAERQLPLDETVQILGNVAAALGYAHRRGVIHRDIKPENILFTGGQAVVADFGIACAIDAASPDRLTGTGVALGTLAYMSPEQAAGERQLDVRSDIYSLGCLAYEMLGGEPPFTGPTPQAVIARHLVDPVPPLGTLRPGLPAGVERAVEKALAKVPADRFATAEEFATTIARANSAEAMALHPRRRRHAARWRTVGVSASVALAAAAVWWMAAVASGSDIRRFAVLPFVDPTNDPGQKYFVEGMHDALISELAQAGLGVIARTSVMQYQKSEKPARAIARELRVDALIETSLTRTPDSVTLQARLVDGSTEEYVWSRSYRGDMRDIAALNRDMAHDIARRVRPGRAREGEPRVAAARPVNPEAYDAYLKGRFHLRQPGRGELETALQYFELALAKDSNYGPAYAGISNVWGVRRQRGDVPAREATPKANAAALRALELDGTLAEPHYALATTRTWGEWDWEGGERAFRQAIKLKPDYPEARAFYAHLLAILGRPGDAMEQMTRARELDPLDPLLASLHGGLLSMMRRHDDAIALFRETLNRSPNHPMAQWRLWLTLHDKGEYAAAFVEAQKSALDRFPEVAKALTRGYQEAGYAGAMRAAAEAQVARSRSQYVGPWNIALWYAAAGENDRAIEWLEKAFEVRDPGMPYLAVHPSWDHLRDDPRFRELVRRMNLPR